MQQISKIVEQISGIRPTANSLIYLIALVTIAVVVYVHYRSESKTLQLIMESEIEKVKLAVIFLSISYIGMEVGGSNKALVQVTLIISVTMILPFALLVVSFQIDDLRDDVIEAIK